MAGKMNICKTQICLIILVAIMIQGCSLAMQSRRMKKTMESWKRSHQSELIAKWGAPERTTSDGKGGTILIFQDSPGYYTIEGHQHVRPGNIRMFYVDEKGIIYSWRYKLYMTPLEYLLDW